MSSVCLRCCCRECVPLIENLASMWTPGSQLQKCCFSPFRRLVAAIVATFPFFFPFLSRFFLLFFFSFSFFPSLLLRLSKSSLFPLMLAMSSVCLRCCCRKCVSLIGNLASISQLQKSCLNHSVASLPISEHLGIVAALSLFFLSFLLLSLLLPLFSFSVVSSPFFSLFLPFFFFFFFHFLFFFKDKLSFSLLRMIFWLGPGCSCRLFSSCSSHPSIFSFLFLFLLLFFFFFFFFLYGGLVAAMSSVCLLLRVRPPGLQLHKCCLHHSIASLPIATFIVFFHFYFGSTIQE